MPLPAIVAVLPKNSIQDIRLSLTEYKQHNCADVRVFADFAGDGVKKPTQKGICIRIELLPALREAIAKMEDEARRLGLLTDKEAA